MHCFVSSEWGVIDFSPEAWKKVVGGEKLSYDEYLEVMKNSGAECRHYFQKCYYELPMIFKGQIEKKNNKNICFKRIFVEGMYRDGVMFDGKEDHVWMSVESFEKYEIGDCVSFFAEVYRYLKTSNGKIINYGLRKPSEIKRIASYEVPSDDELIVQSIDEMICETCFYYDKCDYTYCFLRKK